MTGTVKVGLDVKDESVRIVAVSGTAREGLMLRGAAVADVRQTLSTEKVVRDLCRKVPGCSRGVNCNLGSASLVLQEAVFPEMPLDDLRSAVRIEAQQVIPEPDAMVLDFQVIGEQVEAGARQLAVLIVAAPREAVEARVALLSRAGVRLLSVVPDGIALANAVAALRSAEERAELAINIGRQDTLLAAVLPGDRTVSQVVRHVPGGLDLLDARNATDAIESRKRERAKDQWLQEIERSIQFAERKLDGPVQSLVAAGSGAVSSHLLEWVKQNLARPVDLWNPIESLRRHRKAPSVEFVKQHGSHLAVALGLAMMQET